MWLSCDWENRWCSPGHCTIVQGWIVCLSVWQCELWRQCFPHGFRTLVAFSMILTHVVKFGYKCSSHFRAPVGVRGRHQLGLSVFAAVYLLFGGSGEVLNYIMPFICVSYFYKGKLSFKSAVLLARSLQYHFNMLCFSENFNKYVPFFHQQEKWP